MKRLMKAMRKIKIITYSKDIISNVMVAKVVDRPKRTKNTTMDQWLKDVGI